MKVDKRGIIVAAALDLFARDGLHGVKLRDVAERSGFLLGSLYHFFPEKRQLFDAAVMEAARRVGVESRAVLTADLPPRDRLRAYCRFFIDSIASGDPNFALMDQASVEYGAEDFHETMQAAAGEIYADLERILSELGVRSPAGTPTRWLCSYIISLAYGAGKLHRNHLGLQNLQEPQAVEAFIDGVVDFALAALAGSVRPRARRAKADKA